MKSKLIFSINKFNRLWLSFIIFITKNIIYTFTQCNQVERLRTRAASEREERSLSGKALLIYELTKVRWTIKYAYKYVCTCISICHKINANTYYQFLFSITFFFNSDSGVYWWWCLFIFFFSKCKRCWSYFIAVKLNYSFS